MEEDLGLCLAQGDWEEEQEHPGGLQQALGQATAAWEVLGPMALLQEVQELLMAHMGAPLEEDMVALQLEATVCLQEAQEAHMAHLQAMLGGGPLLQQATVGQGDMEEALQALCLVEGEATTAAWQAGAMVGLQEVQEATAWAATLPLLGLWEAEAWPQATVALLAPTAEALALQEEPWEEACLGLVPCPPQALARPQCS